MAFPVVQRRGSLAPRIDPNDFVVDVAGAVDGLTDTISQVASVARQNRQQEFENSVTTKKLDLMEAQGERAATAHNAEMRLKEKEIAHQTQALELDRQKFAAESVLRSVKIDREKLFLKNEQAQNTEDMIASRAELARLDNKTAQMDANNLIRGKKLEREVADEFGSAMATAKRDMDLEALAEIEREIRTTFGDRISNLPQDSQFHPSRIRQEIGQDAAAQYNVFLLDNKRKNAEEVATLVDDRNKLASRIEGRDLQVGKIETIKGVLGFPPSVLGSDLTDTASSPDALATWFEGLADTADKKQAAIRLPTRRKLDLIEEMQLARELASSLRTGRAPDNPNARQLSTRSRQRLPVREFQRRLEAEWAIIQPVIESLGSDNEKKRDLGMKLLVSDLSHHLNKVEDKSKVARRRRIIGDIETTVRDQRALGNIDRRISSIAASSPNRTEHIQTIRDERRPSQGNVGAPGTIGMPVARTTAERDALPPGTEYLDANGVKSVRR